MNKLPPLKLVSFSLMGRFIKNSSNLLSDFLDQAKLDGWNKVTMDTIRTKAEKINKIDDLASFIAKYCVNNGMGK